MIVFGYIVAKATPQSPLTINERNPIIGMIVFGYIVAKATPLVPTCHKLKESYYRDDSLWIYRVENNPLVTTYHKLKESYYRDDSLQIYIVAKQSPQSLLTINSKSPVIGVKVFGYIVVKTTPLVPTYHNLQESCYWGESLWIYRSETNPVQLP